MYQNIYNILNKITEKKYEHNTNYQIYKNKSTVSSIVKKNVNQDSIFMGSITPLSRNIKKKQQQTD